jgi:serine/threonine protein phosphatase PrpC
MTANGPSPGVHLTVFGLTDVGAVRKNNEDTFLVADLATGRTGLSPEVLSHSIGERGTLLLVSDGMGGAEAGEVASALVAKHMTAELGAAPMALKPEEAVRSAVERTNDVVWREAIGARERRGMGATLVAALVRNSTAYITGVGDSRGYLMRAGRIRQITRDQSMVEAMVEAGALTREEANRHPQRNMILQAMGARPEVVVPIERVELRRGDVLVLCSDGLSSKLSAEEMRDCILSTGTLAEACRRMVELANYRGGEDNITVLLGELDGDNLPATPLGERLTRTLKPIAEFDFKTGAGYAPQAPAQPTVPLGSQSPEQPAVKGSEKPGVRSPESGDKKS